MSPTDDELRDAYRAAATPRARPSCPSAEVLADVVFLQQADPMVVEHLSGCEACAAEVRAVRGAALAGEAIERLPAKPERGVPDLAIAALIVLTLGLVGWAFLLLNRTTALEKKIAALERDSQKRALPAPVVTAPAETRPEPVAYLNVAIVDLEPQGDALRGAGKEPVAVELPDAEAYTFVLTVDPSGRHDNYALEIVDGSGNVILARSGLRRSDGDTFTLGAERGLLPEGVHRIDLFGVDGSARTKLESYRIRVPAP